MIKSTAWREYNLGAVKTTAHFHFNHLQEGDDSSLPELSDLLVRWVSCRGNQNQQNCQRGRKSVQRHLCKLCQEQAATTHCLGRVMCQRARVVSTQKLKNKNIARISVTEWSQTKAAFCTGLLCMDFWVQKISLGSCAALGGHWKVSCSRSYRAGVMCSTWGLRSTIRWKKSFLECSLLKWKLRCSEPVICVRSLGLGSSPAGGLGTPLVEWCCIVHLIFYTAFVFHAGLVLVLCFKMNVFYLQWSQEL